MITTIISYCHLDARFIEANIIQNSIFSNDIIIVYYDKLFNGDIDDDSYLIQISKQYLNITLIKLNFNESHDAKYHHNMARWAGQENAKNQWVLFLDADEIPVGNEFINYIPSITNNTTVCTYFKCHWYFRKPEFQSSVTEECGLLLHKSEVKYDLFFSKHERWNYNFSITCTHQILTDIIFHHYSWVRTKSELLLKTSSWAHQNDKDWAELLDYEFSHDFTGIDPVHNYNYSIAPNIFGISI